jgi:hypothetical protein
VTSGQARHNKRMQPTAPSSGVGPGAVYAWLVGKPRPGRGIGAAADAHNVMRLRECSVGLVAIAVVSASAFGPCARLSANPDVRSVQQSAAFEHVSASALGAQQWSAMEVTSQDSAWYLAKLCDGLRSDSTPLVPGVVFVAGPWLDSFEQEVVVFALAGSQVRALNRADGPNGPGPLDRGAWNHVISDHPIAMPLESEPLARAYACLLWSLDSNGRAPGCEGRWPSIVGSAPWRMTGSGPTITVDRSGYVIAYGPDGA